MVMYSSIWMVVTILSSIVHLSGGIFGDLRSILFDWLIFHVWLGLAYLKLVSVFGYVIMYIPV